MHDNRVVHACTTVWKPQWLDSKPLFLKKHKAYVQPQLKIKFGKNCSKNSICKIKKSVVYWSRSLIVKNFCCFLQDQSYGQTTSWQRSRWRTEAFP